jgi:pimeloyl-ACP methyl ester carboxylesterase
MPATARHIASATAVTYREEVMARGRRAAAVTTAVALLAAGAAGLVVAPTATAEDAGLAAYYGQQLTWSRCGDQECSWLTVPRDYADPSGATVRLRIARTSAPGDARLGSLVINPGGPGASGIDLAGYLVDSLDPRITRAYDIVGFDTRGVGESAPVECLTGPQTTAWLRADVTPDTRRERARLMALARGLARGCLERSADIARHVGSENTVRDMDILRQALGDEHLTFLGYSYGTYLGTKYAEQFPDRVGRFVLDGAVDPSMGIMDVSREQAAGFQQALGRFADDCVRRSNCPWTGGRSAVLAGVQRLLADLDATPLPTEGRPLVQAEALTAVFYSMYSPSMWPMLRSALSLAVAGDGSGLSDLAAYATDRVGPDRYLTNMASAFPAIACWDSPASPDAAGLDRAARRWARGPAVPELSRALSWSNAPCSVWFGRAAGSPAPASTSTKAPILVIGGTYDPATPYSWAKALNRQLPTSTLLTYDGDGHTVYGGTSPCIDELVDAYLLDGRLPPTGTVCR